jgi:hypothetical protein
VRSDPAAASARGPSAPRQATPARGAFALALARARAHPSRVWRSAAVAQERAAALLDASATTAAVRLTRRRRGADDSQQALGERRIEAAGDGRGPASSGPGAAPEAREASVAEAGRAGLWPPGALELLACEARRGDRPSLQLALGREVRVTLVRAARGIEVALEARAGRRTAAEAELPALVAALRERGVVVARAEVRVTTPDRSASEQGRTVSRRAR